MLERMEISIIPQDLRQEETIVQIAEALENLDFAVTHIFDSINQRILENSNRLTNIRERASKLQSQLDYLQTNLNLKAIKMYSAAKYPANHTFKDYKLTILPKSRKEISKYSIYKSPVPISDKLDSGYSNSDNAQYMSNFNLQEKLQYYYVKSKPSIKNLKAQEEQRKRLQLNISSIGALLPAEAKDTQSIANSQMHIHKTSTAKNNQIQDAPDSILQPWHSSDIESPSTYLYAPTLGEVPEINVPLSLPDLPGIVDNERFIFDLTTQNPIAPSSTVATSTSKNESDNIVLDNQAEQKKILADDTDTLKPLCKVFSPPAPSSSSISFDKTSANGTNVTQSPTTVTQTIIPPPPPPLPPLESPLKENEGELEEKSLRKPASAKPLISDDRSSLMAAIRDAGGIGRAKLKPAENRGKDRWSSAAVGGDLMADLHNALSLRRKGIAGSAINALARMSSMIPPPPKPSESSDVNSATSECESQGDDDWEE